ncbi:MAG: FAD-dependent oxidoreductase [Sulfolobaceae archaeon]
MVIIIGAGIAGLSAAISLRKAGYSVKVIYETLFNSSYYSKGGIAAARSPDDSPELHKLDTISVCEELCDPKVVDYFTKRAVEVVEELEKLGFKFDKELRLEGGHSRRRVHSVGDSTGRALLNFFINKVRELEIPLIQDRVIKLIVKDAKVKGILTENHVQVEDSRVVIATGGYSSLFSLSTNLNSSYGEGIAIAFREGTLISDMEFVQFHPTAAIVNNQVILITETLRGEGAEVINQNGERFLFKYHKRGELAPRDILARAIYEEILRGNKVFIDARKVKDVKEKFPDLYNILLKNGINLLKDLIPIYPAAHYTIGGIRVNYRGESNIYGLYAIGEVSDTGFHGSNRLASNSLTECLVQGFSLPLYIDSWEGLYINDGEIYYYTPHYGKDCNLGEIREINWRYLGIIRNGSGIKEALNYYHECNTIGNNRSSNAALVSSLLALSALYREESRGVHYRSDFPLKSEKFRKRIYFTKY